MNRTPLASARPRPTSLTLALAAALPLLAALPVQAQSASPDRLPDVRVSGERASPWPQPLGAQDGAQLITRRAFSSDSAALLQDIPGLALMGAGGVSSLPTLRGLADDRLRIKVDGMDLISACANHMNPPLSYIDPAQVGSLRVFSGVAPVSMGGDSLGGAVQLDSPEPEFARAGEAPLRKGEIGLFYRSNGDAHGGSLAASWANEQFSLSYRAASAQARNYHAAEGFKPAGLAAAGREWLEADAVGSSAYESINQSLALAWRQGQHLWELKLGRQNLPYQGFPNQRMDMTLNESTQLNLRYRGRYDWGTLEARAYRERTRHAMDFGADKLYWYGPTAAQDGIAGPIVPGMAGRAAGMPMDTAGDNTGLSVRAELPLNERDLIRAGLEAQRYQLDDWWNPAGKGMAPDVFWNIRDGQRERQAAFGEWEAAWSPRWTSLLGLRHETVRSEAGPVQGYNPSFFSSWGAQFNAADRARDDGLLDLAAHIRFQPSDTASYEISYGIKNRAPNLYERYAWSVHGMAMRMVNLVGDGNGYVGNLNLRPETARTLSATASWHDAARQQWAVTFSPYVTHVDDYIDAARCSAENAHGCTTANLAQSVGPVYLRYLNQSARLLGFDLAAQMLLPTPAAWGQTRLQGSLSQVRGDNRTTQDRLYNMMPLNAKLALSHQAGAWTTSLEALLVRAKERVNRERLEQPTPGYGLLHLRAGYALGRLQLDFGIENLLDRQYQHPLGGIYLGQGKTMSGSDVATSTPVPGAGRSVYAGMNLKF